METYNTIEKARMAASKKQAQETNTSGWWKIRAVAFGKYEIYYDSAKTRDGIKDDESANTDIFYDEMERRRELRGARRQH